MLKVLLNKYKKEGVLFNIVKDNEITVVTTKRVVFATEEGVLKEKEHDKLEELSKDVEELMNKLEC